MKNQHLTVPLATLPAITTGGFSHTNPAMSYLRGRRSIRSANTMASVLNSIAYMLSETGYQKLDWSGLTADHVQLVMRFIRSTTDEQKKSPAIAAVRERYFTYIEYHKSGPKGIRKRFGPEPDQFHWEAFSINTANLYLAAFKGVAKEAFHLRQLHEAEYLRIKDISGYSTAGHDRDSLKTTAIQVIEVINDCLAQGTNIGVRDAAIIALLYGAGLRREEVQKLKVSDVHFNDKELRFWGKGTKRRVVPMLPIVEDILSKWIAIRAGATNDDGALLVGVNKSDRLLVRYDDNGFVKRTGYNVIYEAIQRRFGSDIHVANFGPHELRAVFGTTLLDNKVPINTVADLMGHQNIQTTRIYDGGKKQRMHDGIKQLKQ